MKRVVESIYALTLALLIGVPSIALAHDEGRSGERGDRRAASATKPAIDPLIQAILIAAAASVLREAAASPDPVATAAESLERKLVFALRSPETARFVDQLIAEAVKEAPQELREPLAQFASAMLNNFRREMLEKRQGSKAY